MVLVTNPQPTEQNGELFFYTFGSIGMKLEIQGEVIAREVQKTNKQGRQMVEPHSSCHGHDIITKLAKKSNFVLFSKWNKRPMGKGLLSVSSPDNTKDCAILLMWTKLQGVTMIRLSVEDLIGSSETIKHPIFQL